MRSVSSLRVVWLCALLSALGCDFDLAVAQHTEPVAAGKRRRRPPLRADAPRAPSLPSGVTSPGLPRSSSSDAQSALGLPYDTSPHDDLLLSRPEYVVSYNPFRNAPNWVAWRITASDLGTTGRTRSRFAPDPLLPPGVYRVLDGDYAGSGFDRGHLCPSASRTHNEASNAATFYTTNILPQRHDLNVGAWEALEAWTHRMVRAGWDAFVLAGGVWPAACDTSRRTMAPGPDCPSIGRSQDPARRVAVPLSFWKVVVLVPAGGGPEAVSDRSPVVAVVMPNDGRAGADWRRYLSTVDALEVQTGYELLSAVPVAIQQRIEAMPYQGE